MSVKFTFSNLFLILFIGIISTVTITENLQAVDGFSAEAKKIIYKMQVGETMSITWGLVNELLEPIDVELYAEGIGSELMVMERYVTIPPQTRVEYEIFVIVPPDHEDNVEFHPTLYALKRGFLEEGKTGAVVNMRMKNLPVIEIGDNPIYTPTEAEINANAPAPKFSLPEKKTDVEKSKVETLEEKLAKIQAANEAKQITPKVSVTKTPEVKDDVFIPELIMDEEPVADNGGGCLIATATFGSELAPQVQLLREIRDNKLSNTESGVAFMAGFNQLYYSFSPMIADLERDNPVFKELVKIAITPMISSLSLMEYANTESKVLGYGISLIILNLGMYLGIPVVGLVRLYQLRK